MNTVNARAGREGWDVFISYCHQDLERAENVESSLVSAGLKVWRDTRLKPGRLLSPEIASALRSASRVVVLWSESANQSDWVKDEAAFACCHAKLLPVTLDGSAPPEPFNKIVALRLSDPVADAAQIVELLSAPVDFAQTQIWPAANLYDEKLKTVHITENLIGRDDELNILKGAWRSGCALKDETVERNAEPPDKTNLIVLHAAGGTGKTALIYAFYRWLQRAGWWGAERAYIWSFYSQGTDEKRQGSADEFLFHALQWFGYSGEIPELSPSRRGIELASLVAKHRALLILDGLEPLQYSSGQGQVLQGALKDTGVWELLRRLARDNRGLCIITTRLAIRELENANAPQVLMRPLEQLSTAAGVELLRKLGVYGTHDELEKAAQDFSCHAFTLTLLAHYLTDEEEGHGGDIRRRDCIPSLIDYQEEHEQGGHAKRVMARYRVMFEERIKAHARDGQKPHQTVAARQLSLLYLLGLFDHPAPLSVLKHLTDIGVKGLTEPLEALTETQWKGVLRGLRKLGLLNRTQSNNESNTELALDSHPLVREYFSSVLRAKNYRVWKKAHASLFNYFRNSSECAKPQTIHEIERSIDAIRHGCAANLCLEAFEEIYWPDLHRGEHFVATRLFAPAVDLHALAQFFKVPWNQLADGFKTGDQGAILFFAGSSLQSAGRVQESIPPLRAACNLSVAAKDWENAAIGTMKLCGATLTQGDVPSANLLAQEALAYAKKQHEEELVMRCVGLRADTEYLSGNLQKALSLFRRVERATSPKDDFGEIQIFRIQGREYNEVLLSSGDDVAVWRRSSFFLRAYGSPMYRGLFGEGFLYELALAWMWLGRAKAAEDTSNGAKECLDTAVDDLRQAAVQHELPRALLARASFHLRNGNCLAALPDLQDVWEIAEHSGMRLYQIDCLLEWARLELALGAPDCSSARERITASQRLIEATGYGRRWPDWHLLFARLALTEKDVPCAREHLVKANLYVENGWKIHAAELKSLNERCGGE